MGDVQGTPLIEMSLDDFVEAVATAMRTQLATTKAAAKRMIKQRSGVILSITAPPNRMAMPNVGGFGPACGALKALSRSLAAEVGPHGIRVICLRSAGSPDSKGASQAFEQNAKASGTTREGFQEQLESGTWLHRLPLLAEVGNVAAFMASDRASALTGTVANLTCGQIAD